LQDYVGDQRIDGLAWLEPSALSQDQVHRKLLLNMIATLTRTAADGRLDEKLKLHTAPRLLIGGENGYLRSLPREARRAR
jgi:hypothetical protein